MDPLRKRALGLYKPPFKYAYGYIMDANGSNISDDGGALDRIARVRDWGRLKYLVKSEAEGRELQDEIGDMIAEALTKFWADAFVESTSPSKGASTESWDH